MTKINELEEGIDVPMFEEIDVTKFLAFETPVMENDFDLEGEENERNERTNENDDEDSDWGKDDNPQDDDGDDDGKGDDPKDGGGGSASNTKGNEDNTEGPWHDSLPPDMNLTNSLHHRSSPTKESGAGSDPKTDNRQFLKLLSLYLRCE